MSDEDTLDKTIRLAEEAATLAWKEALDFQDDGAFTNATICESASREISKVVTELKQMRDSL